MFGGEDAETQSDLSWVTDPQARAAVDLRPEGGKWQGEAWGEWSPPLPSPPLPKAAHRVGESQDRDIQKDCRYSHIKDTWESRDVPLIIPVIFPSPPPPPHQLQLAVQKLDEVLCACGLSWHLDRCSATCSQVGRWCRPPYFMENNYIYHFCPKYFPPVVETNKVHPRHTGFLMSWWIC